MTDPVIKTPNRILLATDLSPRCDRAVARAVQLAGRWKAGIVAVHCLGKTAPLEAEMFPNLAPWRSGPEAKRMAERQLAKDLAAFGGNGDIVVEEGDAADIIHSVAEERGCGLVVTGPATKESFWTSILGSTTDHLLRLSPRPMRGLRTSFVRLEWRDAPPKRWFDGIGRGSAGPYRGVDADNHSSHANRTRVGWRRFRGRAIPGRASHPFVLRSNKCGYSLTMGGARCRNFSADRRW